jgi:hypothetical protein
MGREGVGVLTLREKDFFLGVVEKLRVPERTKLHRSFLYGFQPNCQTNWRRTGDRGRSLIDHGLLHFDFFDRTHGAVVIARAWRCLREIEKHGEFGLKGAFEIDTTSFFFLSFFLFFFR